MTQTLVREIVITTEEPLKESELSPNGLNGLTPATSSDDPADFSLVPYATRLNDAIVDAWKNVPEDVKKVSIYSLVGVVALVFLFILTVLFRVVLEHFDTHTGFVCSLIGHVDSVLGTSLTESLCVVHADLLDRLSFHSSALSEEISTSVADFVDQLHDGFNVGTTIVGNILSHYGALIADAFSELFGNVEENLSFLRGFGATVSDYIGACVHSFLHYIHETVATSH